MPALAKEGERDGARVRRPSPTSAVRRLWKTETAGRDSQDRRNRGATSCVVPGTNRRGKGSGAARDSGRNTKRGRHAPRRGR